MLVDAKTGRTLTVISMQYNPDALTRSYQPQTLGDGDQGEALRFKGPAIETINVEAEIDAADQLEFPGDNPDVVEHGIQPQLAALESLINPTSRQLTTNEALAQAGTLEIIPMEAPLALFVWSKNRIVPVRVTAFNITEEAFDVTLNPIRAKVSLALRILSVADLGFEHRGGGLFMGYLENKEKLAAKAVGATLKDFGLSGLP